MFVHEPLKIEKLGIEKDDSSILKKSYHLYESNLFNVRQDHNTTKNWNVVTVQFSLQNKLNLNNNSKTIAIVYCRENLILTETKGDAQINVYSDTITNYVINLPDIPVDAVIISDYTIMCTTHNIEQILVYWKEKLITQKSMKSVKCLSVDKNDTIILTTGDSIYCSSNHGQDWQKMLSVPGVLMIKAIRVTVAYPHIVWLLNESKDGIFFLTSFKCLFNGICIRELNIEMRDCEGESIHANNISWDYQNTIFITDPDNNCVHIYDLTGKYDGKISVDKGRFDNPQGIAFDFKSGLLYLGQNHGNVVAYEKHGCQTNYHLQCSFK